jgi:hypothetical protein
MRWLLLGYLFLYVHRPFEVWPSLDGYRLELLYMLLTGGLWLAAARKCWIADPLHAAFAAFSLAVVICWAASPWAHVPRPDVPNYLKLLPCYLLLVTLLHEERHLKFILLGFLVIMTLYMSHSLWEYANGKYQYRMNVARLLGIDNALGDANRFGSSIVFALPFVVPTWTAYRSVLVRSFLLGHVGLAFVCVGLTGSRSAFVGLLLCVGMMIWRSRCRWPLAITALLASPLLWAALPASLQNRFETIINPSAGPKSAQESAQGRLEGLTVGLQLWEKFPLTGCGPGLWIPATGRRLQSHNLYGQVAGEMGTLGVVTFGIVILSFWVNLRRLKLEYRCHPEWGNDFLLQVLQAVGLGVLLLLAFGNFSHNLFRHNWLWFGGFLVVAGQCVRQRLACEERPAPRLVAEPSWC